MKILTVISLVLASLILSSIAPSAQNASRELTYLPYGLPIPAGVEITQIPPPFTKAVHGQPIRNTMPRANLVGRPDVQLPRRDNRVSRDEAYTPTFEPGSGDRGLWLTAGEGIYATNDASLTLSIPDVAIGTTLYTPTHLSPGGACMETVTAHWRYQGMGATAHGHGFWDFCESDGQGGWQVFELMDSIWTNRYVRKSQGKLRYWTQVYQDFPLSWKGLLYNFEQGVWEEKTAITGLSRAGFGQTGWTMWESHYLMDVARVCPKFPDIQASDLQVYVNGAWTRLTASNSDDTLGPFGQCWLDDTYTFRISSKRDVWLARTSR